MTLVIDASVAVHWLLRRPLSDAASALFARDSELIAPDLIYAEVCNTAFKLLRADEIPSELAVSMIKGLPQLLSLTHPLEPLARRSLELTTVLSHPAYDCFYLALAEAEGATLVTADKRLLSRLTGTRYESLATAL